MSYSAWPEGLLDPTEMQMSLRGNTQSGGRSPFDGTEQTLELPGAVWVASLTFRLHAGEQAPYAGQAQVLEAFLASLRGRAGRFTFDVPARFSGPGQAVFEANRFNLLARSGDFAVSPWVFQNTTWTGSSLRPDGSTGAVKLTENNGGGQKSLRQVGFAVQAGQVYTASAFVRGGERRLTLFFQGEDFGGTNSDQALRWDAPSQTILNAGALVLEFGSQPAAEGWTRIWVTSRARVTTNDSRVQLALITGAGGAVQNYSGDGVSGVEVWGVQVSEGFAPGSYFPTLAAPAGGPIVVNGAGQTGAIISIAGLPASQATLMRAGSMISWQDPTGRAALHMVTADVGSSNGGLASVPISPPIRRPPADGAFVHPHPRAVWRLATDQPRIRRLPSLVTEFQIEIEETLW